MSRPPAASQTTSTRSPCTCGTRSLIANAGGQRTGSNAPFGEEVRRRTKVMAVFLVRPVNAGHTATWKKGAAPVIRLGGRATPPGMKQFEFPPQNGEVLRRPGRH
jgi:hypothetical protein